jgi:hypothetical protein
MFQAGKEKLRLNWYKSSSATKKGILRLAVQYIMTNFHEYCHKHQATGNHSILAHFNILLSIISTCQRHPMCGLEVLLDLKWKDKCF